MYVDSHAHLDSDAFSNDLEDVLSRAKQAGVEKVLSIGCLSERAESGTRLLELVESVPWLYAAFGVHPHDASVFSDKMESRLLQLLKHPKALALGEIGLDFFYDNAPRETQLAVFRRQVRLARQVGKPMIVHTRDAEKETIELLEQEGVDLNPAGIMHCFTGSQELAERTLALGFHIAFGGILTFRKADELRQVAARVPAERLLIETDCPYLAPEPFRGKRNEPAHVTKVAEILADLRGCSASEIGRVTSGNFRRLFQLSDGCSED